MLYRNIIVAAENDEKDQELCDRAAILARKLGAGVSIFHSFETQTPMVAPGVGDVHMLNREEDLEMINSAKLKLEDLAKRMGGIDVETIVVESNDVRGAIHEHAIKSKADLIIVGSRGRTGLSLMLAGDTARDILKDSPCDVLAVNISL